ncbi:energy-coupling factor ABC transporter ATP-binding protein [Fusibacter sp. JL298sf-3]
MIKCEGLSLQYPDGTIGIQKVDFDLSNGHIIGVIGANGAGKSTFFKCLLGLLKPQSGALYFNGSPLTYSKAALKQLRRAINLVFQDPERQLFYNDVVQDVSMGPRNLGYDAKTVADITDNALRAVDGLHLKERPIQYLSFGQKKRIAIAGVLALSCDVLLMDEPETGLDPQMRRDMIALMRQLTAQEKKIILSSHNMDLIYDVCDYVYVMHRGEMVGHGDKETIMTDAELLEKCRLELPLRVSLRRC